MMSYLHIPRSWHIANAQGIYAKFSWPLHCMICFMSQTYLNQTFKNQERAGMDGKPDSTFISASGLMFPARLPSFWPRFPSSSLVAWSKYKHNSCSDPDPLLLLAPAQQCLLLWPHLWNRMCDQGNSGQKPGGASWHCTVPEWHPTPLAVCKPPGRAKQNKLSRAHVPNVLPTVSPTAESRCRCGPRWSPGRSRLAG